MPPIYPVRRRPRECRTCLPCRASKVRCDRNLPCSHCVKRNHPEHCVYSRPPTHDLPAPYPPSSSAIAAPPLPPPRPPTSFPPQLPPAPTELPPNRLFYDSLSQQLQHPHPFLIHQLQQHQQQQQRQRQHQHQYQHQQQLPPKTSFNDVGRKFHGTISPSQSTGQHYDPTHGAPDAIHLPQVEWDRICRKVVAMEDLLEDLRGLFRTNNDSPQHNHAPQQLRSPQYPSIVVESVESSDRESETPQYEGIYGSNAAHTGTVHLGPRSVFVDILEKSKSSNVVADSLLKEDLLADLVLGNEPAAYPFSDLWSQDPFNFNISSVCGVLPDDQQCRR